MGAPPIRIKVDGEHRTDWATRNISIVENAPQYSYEKSGTWRNPGTHTVTWQVSTVRISWDKGAIKHVEVRGHRLKKDGTVGLVQETAYFRPLKEDPTRLVGHGPGYDSATHEWGWLNTLVKEHSTVPAFDAEAE